MISHENMFDVKIGAKYIFCEEKVAKFTHS